LVVLPAFILRRNTLNGDRIRVGVEIRQYFIFWDPTAIDLIRKDELSGLVVEVKNDVFAEVF
jgi:hypothetical protein